MSYAEALNDAIRSEMARDERVVVLGEDVGTYGGVFSVTQGLVGEFGADRVVDTPISENGIVGAAVGMAVSGLRPIVEIMFADFLPLALDSLANAAAALPFAYGGQVTVPLVVRTQGGAGSGAGPQHSKSLEAWTAHLPGVHTVVPGSPASAKGLLTSAIRSDDPVVLVEHKRLYTTRGPVPLGEHRVPIGSAAVLRQGGDVTVIALSAMVGAALEAADELAGEGVDAEVVDVRSLSPLDTGTLAASARKTGRVLVATEAWVRYGPGAEIAAAVTEAAFDRLVAPVVRVGTLGTPIPASPVLERAAIPDAARIRQQAAVLAKAHR